jgi:hypothetical protein
MSTRERRTFCITTLDGAEHKIKILPVDLLMVERATIGRKVGDAETGLRYVHQAAARLGITTADFEAFVAELDDFDPVTVTDTEAGPTRTRRAA